MPHLAKAGRAQHALALWARERIVVSHLAQELDDPNGRSRKRVEGSLLGYAGFFFRVMGFFLAFIAFIDVNLYARTMQ